MYVYLQFILFSESEIHSAKEMEPEEESQFLKIHGEICLVFLVISYVITPFFTQI